MPGAFPCTGAAGSPQFPPEGVKPCPQSPENVDFCRAYPRAWAGRNTCAMFHCRRLGQGWNSIHGQQRLLVVPTPAQHLHGHSLEPKDRGLSPEKPQPKRKNQAERNKEGTFSAEGCGADPNCLSHNIGARQAQAGAEPRTSLSPSRCSLILLFPLVLSSEPQPACHHRGSQTWVIRGHPGRQQG